MIKAEAEELRRRYKITRASFSRIAGCYVNDNKEKICTFNRQFLNLPEDEIFKYLDIAGKLLSGKLNDNLLNLEFPLPEEKEGGRQHRLMELRDTELRDAEKLNAFYDAVIEAYEKTGNYLILLFADRYDIPVKTKDNIRNDESDEVFSYILCGICPVELSEPGLSYAETENTFLARIRDWVVGAPESGFLFPVFNDRSTDIHGCLFYTRDPKEPHKELTEQVLGCSCGKTSSEQRRAFCSAVKSKVGSDEDRAKQVYSDVQYALSIAAETYEETMGEGASLTVTDEVLTEALGDAGVAEENIARIVTAVAEILPDRELQAADIRDASAVKEGGRRAEKKVLVELLNEKTEQLKSLDGGNDTDVISVFVQDKDMVSMQEIDGKLCVVVPAEGFRVLVNGKRQEQV